MRKPEQVADSAVAQVVEMTANGAELNGKVWRTAITTQVAQYKMEIGQALAEALLKIKGLKANQRKTIAAELDKAMRGE